MPLSRGGKLIRIFFFFGIDCLFWNYWIVWLGSVCKKSMNSHDVRSVIWCFMKSICAGKPTSHRRTRRYDGELQTFMWYTCKTWSFLCLSNCISLKFYIKWIESIVPLWAEWISNQIRISSKLQMIMALAFIKEIFTIFQLIHRICIQFITIIECTIQMYLFSRLVLIFSINISIHY